MGPDEWEDREETRWLLFLETHNVRIQGDRVVVTLATFDELDEYSCTIPGGTVIGKIWKRGEPYVEPRTSWYLGQYTKADDPERVNIVWRTLCIEDPLLPEVRPATDELIESLRAAHNAVATMEAR